MRREGEGGGQDEERTPKSREYEAAEKTGGEVTMEGQELSFATSQSGSY